MLNKIIAFSLRNRALVVLATLILIIGGCWTAKHMEVDVFPDLNAPTVVIMTEAKGMAAEEVERLVTFPIETAVNGATDVRRVRSSSTMGFSVVWVEFDWDTDIYRDRQIVSEKLSTIADAMPEGVGTPTLGPQSSILGEVLFIGLTADSTSQTDLRTLADWTIRPQLLSMGGVAQVTVMGGNIMEYQVQLHPERMRHYGVGLSEVLDATQAMTRNATGGVLYEYGNEYILRGLLSTSDADEMSQSVVKLTPQGRPVVLADVADVFNAVLMKGDMLGDVVFYGKGAGKLPTASAVVADVIDCCKHLKTRKFLYWADGNGKNILPWEESSRAMYVRANGSNVAEKAEKLFGEVTVINKADAPADEKAFVVKAMPYNEFAEKIAQLEADGVSVLSSIRVADL